MAAQAIQNTLQMALQAIQTTLPIQATQAIQSTLHIQRTLISPANPASPTDQAFYLLPLTDEGAPDIPGGHNYIYLPPPSDPSYLLRFSIQGTSSICRQGSLWVNLPAKGEPFERSKFREYK